MDESAAHGLHLRRADDRGPALEALAALLGGRVGLEGVLADLDRRAHRTWAPGRAVGRALTWDRPDRGSPRWWPQGISSSADAAADAADSSAGERFAGRRLLAVAWYARPVAGESTGQGVRVSFLDLDTRRYRHVLLVVPVQRDGEVTFEPLRVHAGGLLWAGDHLHVAATRRGFVSCRVGDVLRVPDALAGDPGRLGVDGRRVSSYGYRYLLPVHVAYRAGHDAGHEGLRHSFLSLDRSGTRPTVLVGEYGDARSTHRLARFPLDPSTLLPAAGEDGLVRALDVVETGVARVQGAVVARGTTYLTVSHSMWGLGSVHAGRPGAFRHHRAATPMGPEDLTWWPSTDSLWSVTEHPHRRWVFAMDRAALDRGR